MARTKKITVEGHDYVIGSLTMDQVEEFWEDPDVSIHGIRARTWLNILYSIQNAGGDIPLDQIKKQVTLEGYAQLYGEVLDISYLRTKDPGEQPAATETPTSSSSVAA